MIDQATFDFIKSVVYATSKYEVVALVEVVTADIVGGYLELDPNSIETLPRTLERKIYSFPNCRSKEKAWKQNTKITKSYTFSSSLTKTATSTTDRKVTVNLGEKAVKFNYEIMQKDVFEVSTSQSQSRTETQVEDYEIDELVPPHTAYYMQETTVKGLVRGRVAGTVTYDAGVEYIVRLGPATWRVAELNNGQYFNTEPKYRTTAIEGFIYANGFERVERVFAEKALKEDDPICKITDDLAQPWMRGNATATGRVLQENLNHSAFYVPATGETVAKIDLRAFETPRDGQFEIEFDIETEDCESSAAATFRATLVIEKYDGESATEEMYFAGWSASESGESSFTIKRTGSFNGRQLIDVVDIEQVEYVCFDDSASGDA